MIFEKDRILSWEDKEEVRIELGYQAERLAGISLTRDMGDGRSSHLSSSGWSLAWVALNKMKNVEQITKLPHGQRGMSAYEGIALFLSVDPKIVKVFDQYNLVLPGTKLDTNGTSFACLKRRSFGTAFLDLGQTSPSAIKQTKRPFLIGTCAI